MLEILQLNSFQSLLWEIMQYVFNWSSEIQCYRLNNSQCLVASIIFRHNLAISSHLDDKGQGELYIKLFQLRMKLQLDCKCPTLNSFQCFCQIPISWIVVSAKWKKNKLQTSRQCSFPGIVCWPSLAQF